MIRIIELKVKNIAKSISVNIFVWTFIK